MKTHREGETDKEMKPSPLKEKKRKKTAKETAKRPELKIQATKNPNEKTGQREETKRRKPNKRRIKITPRAIDQMEGGREERRT